MQKSYFAFLFFFGACFTSSCQSQTPVFFKGAVKEKKTVLKKNIVQNTITKNLSTLLSADTEDYWIDAFEGMELLRYKSPWTDAKIYGAFDSLEQRSENFQRALLELAYSNYPSVFKKQVTKLMNSTSNTKVFAMCAEYLMLSGNYPFGEINLPYKKQSLVKTRKDEAIFEQLLSRLQQGSSTDHRVVIKKITSPDFLKNHIVLYSFQRKNRNYPGIVLIRDSAGNFVHDDYGNYFSVPQLARSVSNLPGYLTNGNTPQGIFRMYGFDTSKASFIGPTTNIQLTMPFEASIQHFLDDSTILDTTWTINYYKELLPDNLKTYLPLYESFYAGEAGRTEIIAHGTTVDPEYYNGQTYYPQTPTLGCLCTKEIWSEEDGRRLESDQEKLVAALTKAGGADGYCVVIEIDDQQKPVNLYEVVSMFNTK